jgi:hypothetical protein
MDSAALLVWLITQTCLVVAEAGCQPQRPSGSSSRAVQPGKPQGVSAEVQRHRGSPCVRPQRRDKAEHYRPERSVRAVRTKRQAARQVVPAAHAAPGAGQAGPAAEVRGVGPDIAASPGIGHG